MDGGVVRIGPLGALVIYTGRGREEEPLVQMVRLAHTHAGQRGRGQREKPTHGSCRPTSRSQVAGCPI